MASLRIMCEKKLMIGSGGKTSNRASALIQTEPTDFRPYPILGTMMLSALRAGSVVFSFTVAL